MVSRVSKTLSKLRWGQPASVEQFAYDGERVDSGAGASDLEEFFWNNEGVVVHKWLHYFPIYERYFAPFRDKPIRMLEIGVSKGGSLAMWRSYFGPQARLFGVDVDPSCAELDGQSGQVRIGSQADPEFLRSVVEEMGGIDIVLDDGSHDSEHIRSSLDVLYPLLSDGGVYMIEDLHAAYWASYTGGYNRPSSFMTDVKVMIDDIHHWYHNRGERIASTAGHLSGIHVHDSIVVLDKLKIEPPRHARRGKEE